MAPTKKAGQKCPAVAPKKAKATSGVTGQALRFTATQRRQLAELQVLPEQITALENALPLCQALDLHTATMTDVRDELENVLEVMATADLAIRRISSATSPAVRESCARMQEHWMESDEEQFVDAGGRLGEPILSALADLRSIALGALLCLPKERRTRAVSWRPVERIHHALQSGWGHAVAASRSRLPFPHFPRTTSDGLFAQVVGICYRVMRQKAGEGPDDGTPRPSADRQIRAYVRWLKARRVIE